MLRLLFWVKNLSEVYFLGQPIIQLLFSVHEECRIIFMGLELEKRLRNREKYGYGLSTKLDVFLSIAAENLIIIRVFRMICKS